MVRKPVSGVLLSSAVYGALGQGAGRQKRTRERWLPAGLTADGRPGLRRPDESPRSNTRRLVIQTVLEVEQ